MDGDTAYLVGRAFARVIAGLRGKATTGASASVSAATCA